MVLRRISLYVFCAAVSCDAVQLKATTQLSQDGKKEQTKCQRAVGWAKKHGLEKYPKMFAGLTEDSTAEDFKAVFARKKLHNCKDEMKSNCSVKALWAHRKGIQINPEWYPGLDPSSTVEEFKSLFAICGKYDCASESARQCKECVQWAKNVDYAQHPGLYEGLTEFSTLKEFESMFSARKQHGCHVSTSSYKAQCCDHVANWAKTNGVIQSPHWYGTLTRDSSIEDFKIFFASQSRHGCKAAINLRNQQQPEADSAQTDDVKLLSNRIVVKNGKLPIGSLVPLTDAGYQRVVLERDDEEMASFMKRVLMAAHHHHTSGVDFLKMVERYSGRYGVKSFDDMLMELGGSPYVRDERSVETKKVYKKLRISTGCGKSPAAFLDLGHAAETKRPSWMSELVFCKRYDCRDLETMITNKVVEARINPDCPARNQFRIFIERAEGKGCTYEQAIEDRSVDPDPSEDWLSWDTFCETISKYSGESCYNIDYDEQLNPSCPVRLQYRLPRETP